MSLVLRWGYAIYSVALIVFCLTTYKLYKQNLWLQNSIFTKSIEQISLWETDSYPASQDIPYFCGNLIIQYWSSYWAGWTQETNGVLLIWHYFQKSFHLKGKNFVEVDKYRLIRQENISFIE
jgi:hypothetical protein